LTFDTHGTYLPTRTGSVAEKEAAQAMCYTRRDQRFEEEARRLRAEEDRRRRTDSERRPSEGRQEDKPLTEKVKEMVGAR
jgi:hypothetical protein